jgi:hypothetical protein
MKTERSEPAKTVFIDPGQVADDVTGRVRSEEYGC